MHYKSHRVPGDPAPTSVFAEMDRDRVENSRPVAEPDGAGPRIKSRGRNRRRRAKAALHRATGHPRTGARITAAAVRRGEECSSGISGTLKTAGLRSSDARRQQRRIS
jgi:hypothetical protein